MKNSEAVSKVINSFKFLNKDERISKRYVLRLLRDASKNLISQKLLDRTISEESNLYTIIPCFEFKEVDIVSCPIIEFRKCEILMKSKKPLPELVFSRHGSSIKEITSLDDLTEIYLTTPDQYRRDRKRQYYSKEDTYLYIDADNYAYIVDKPILAVNMIILTMKTDEVYEVSACSDNNLCKSGWDYEFIVPDKLEETVFKEVLQILSSTYAARREDQNPNSVEGI
jgi:hypothetical protein